MNLPTAPTRERVLDAFAATLLEQPYETITVTQVLARSGVGRASFYEHFRHKEDLLAQSVQRLGLWLRQEARAAARPLAFLRPYLLHVDSHRAIYQSFAGRDSMPVLERYQSRMLMEVLRDDLVAHGLPAGDDALALHFIVGAWWSVLQAWLERRLEGSPDEVHARLLVLSAGCSGIGGSD